MRAPLVCLVLLTACRARTPTYHRDVAPILARYCADCHHRGGVAAIPPLDSYENVREYAQPIRLAVQTRRMPPWGIDDTGLCGTWEGARWMTTEEIATLTRWEQANAPEGEPATAPAWSPPATPFRADATVTIGGVYRPGLGPGGNRCFVADPRLDRDRLLSAIRVDSSDARAVAQVTLFALDTPQQAQQAAALDAADPGLGYACYGTARVDGARFVTSWTWPDPVLRMPAGTGVRLRAGGKLVIQIHYDISLPGTAFQSETHVGLELDDHAREARYLEVAATGSLPPAQRYIAVETRVPVERPLTIVGISPRMHIRGETMHVTIERGGANDCLATFDHWRFKNQQLFVAHEPTRVAPGERIHLSCWYNTLGRAQPVRFGDLIDDEECVARLLITD